VEDNQKESQVDDHVILQRIAEEDKRKRREVYLEAQLNHVRDWLLKENMLHAAEATQEAIEYIKYMKGKP